MGRLSYLAWWTEHSSSSSSKLPSALVEIPSKGSDVLKFAVILNRFRVNVCSLARRLSNCTAVREQFFSNCQSQAENSETDVLPYSTANVKALSNCGHRNENDLMDVTKEVTTQQLKPPPPRCVLLTCPNWGVTTAGNTLAPEARENSVQTQ